LITPESNVIQTETMNTTIGDIITRPPQISEMQIKIEQTYEELPAQTSIPTKSVSQSTITPVPSPTPEPALIPTDVPITNTIMDPTPIPQPSENLDPNTAVIITIEIELPELKQKMEADILSVISKNNSYWLEIQVHSDNETYDNIIKNIIVNDSYEYVVRLSKFSPNTYRGKFNIDDHLLKEKTLKWIDNNLIFRVANFPERVACTGSMRPIIHCGDKVIYEPANHGEPLQVGDIITFRQMVEDIDASTECPVYDNVITIVEGYIIHRIVQVLSSYNINRYMTRGDNNPEQDSCLVKEEHIIFKTIEIIPRYYVINDTKYDENQMRHQELLKERDSLMNDYDSALSQYNTYRTLDAAQILTNVVNQLEKNLVSLTDVQQGITDAVSWEE